MMALPRLDTPLASMRSAFQSLVPLAGAMRTISHHADADIDRPRIGRRIEARGLTKSYEFIDGRRRVLDDLSFVVGAGEKIAVLGRNGAGKSTLVKLIGGVEPPDRGAIHRGMSMSWPIAFAGGFEPSMSGLDNIRFIARLYDKAHDAMIDAVDEFAELGRYLRMPVETYSSGMRMRLAFALTLAVDFECFLIDEVIAVGDQRFQAKCFRALFEERRHCAMILVTHDPHIVQRTCSKALVLKNGRGRMFEDVPRALEIYQTL
jgi:capsular polysaccharide transport system ATP-binding protein